MFQTKTFIERIPKCKCVGYVANAVSDFRLALCIFWRLIVLSC